MLSPKVHFWRMFYFFQDSFAYWGIIDKVANIVNMCMLMAWYLCTLWLIAPSQIVNTSNPHVFIFYVSVGGEAVSCTLLAKFSYTRLQHSKWQAHVLQRSSGLVHFIAESLYPFTNNLPSFPLPRCWQHLFYAVSCLLFPPFREMPSSSIHFAQKAGISFSSWLHNIPLYVIHHIPLSTHLSFSYIGYCE